jgi:NhaP-type Na+/H+ or K+/H+ antiporter
VRLPRDISPAAAARRSLLADSLGALALAAAALILCAGLGIVGVISLVTLLAIGPWFAIEARAKRLRRRRHARPPRRQAALRDPH